MKFRPPGLLEKENNPDLIMMICTAGHVDHGKTALVKLLTGCNTDRLKEEQERGMTIELGFAPCFLGGNLYCGIVDVPGHEKFIKNMVAGVSGIDLAILIIAADDGIMPQTIEHLQIMELLGVRSGIVALTKIDLVTKERINEVSQGIQNLLKDTFMENVPICPVYSVTFDGYFEFYELLVNKIKSLSKKTFPGIFRMPIGTVFSRKGFGTVVTGIPVSGTIEIGAQVEVIPSNQIGKIKGMQRFGRDAASGGIGQCLALNIPDFSRKPPVRGQVISLPDYLKSATIFHIHIKVLPDLEKPLQNAEQIKFHTGTAEESGKIYLLEELSDKSLLATVVLHNPITTAINDRLIIRRLSPNETVAGGEILDITYENIRPRKIEIIKQLKNYLEFFKGIDLTSNEGIIKKIEYLLTYKKKSGASLIDISKGTLLPMDTVKNILMKLIETKKVISLSEGSTSFQQNDYFIMLDDYNYWLSVVKSQLEKATKEEKALSVTVSDLSKELNFPSPLWERIQKDLERENLVIARGGKLALKGAIEVFNESERKLLEKLIKIYEDTGFESPRPDELSDILKASQSEINRLLEYLFNEKKLIQLSKNVILSHKHLVQAQNLVIKTISEKGVLDSGDFKHMINSTRKYALAILDYFDSQRITIRINNHRKLTPDYQRYLF